MKKVIKPSKQPTKKQSIQSQRNVRSQRSKQSKQTAKLKIAIGKIAAQLVKNHPKLVKGGGSSDITELIFSKNLMKGGEIGEKLRDDIVKFLKDFAPKVNDLKKELIIKLIHYILDNDKSARGGDLELQMLSLNEEFKKGVYEYQLKIEETYIKKLKDNKKDIYDDFLILDIVGRFFTLSRIDGDILNEINKTNFKELSGKLLDALVEYDKGKNEEKKKNIQALLEEYKKDETEKTVNKVMVVEEIDNELAPVTNEKLFAVPDNLSDSTDRETELRVSRLEGLEGSDGLEETLLKLSPKKETVSTGLLRGDKGADAKKEEVVQTKKEVVPAKVEVVPEHGGNPTKYKSTGQVVNIMYKKRKYKRTIFVKEKRKTKYCKINNEYILLSKLNVL
jgi:hypothetical protein